ncbi:MAG: AAA family ATPase [Campylobacterota bacterium]|nr:AAA family ATPase [Campylobacterota bacterium]
MNKLKKKIEPFIEAGYPIIYIDAYEEMKVDEALKEFDDKKVDMWSLINQESLEEFLEPYVLGTEELDEVFIVLKDIHSFLESSHPQNQKIISMLKKIVHKILVDEDAYANIIMISPIVKIPLELEKYITIFEIDLPRVDEIRTIINEFITLYEEEIEKKELELLASALKGLSENEINMLLNLTMQENGDLNFETSKLLIAGEKKQIIRKSGILEMVETKLNVNDIGGLDTLKSWLKKKSLVFKDMKRAKEYGVDTPKGAFIVGMPGCGKSLTAKATALLFDNIPLLRLDIGRLMGKYVGESEGNMRKAITQAEAISPCILWIDEIEKSFTGIGSGGHGSEVATRLFGYFLTWMQEKTSEVYVIATANDISNLPPELLRKGRFDEVFFVDFPNKKERKQIFEVHILNRKKDIKHIKGIDFSKLADKTEGYSGADIETVVKESIEECFINGVDIASTDDYLKVIKEITGISEMLPEKVKEYEKMRDKMKVKSAT